MDLRTTAQGCYKLNSVVFHGTLTFVQRCESQSVKFLQSHQKYHKKTNFLLPSLLQMSFLWLSVCTVCALRAYCARRGWDTHPRIPVTCLLGGRLKGVNTIGMARCPSKLLVVVITNVLSVGKSTLQGESNRLYGGL